MDVRLSPEQQALKDSAVQVVGRLAAQSVRDLDDPERAAKLDSAVAASGWRELRTPSDGGAPWASAVEAAIVAEELSRGLADTAFVGPTLAADLRRLAGAPAGPSHETVALSRDLSGPASMTTGAVAIDAAGATDALVVDALGILGRVTLTSSPTGPDLTRPSVALDNSVITPVGLHPITVDGLARWRALALALTCADLVGVMRGVIELAGDYVKSRRQFGVPVASFQSVQHILADAFVSMEGSRSVSLHAAWGVDALEPREALAAAAIAKAYCARAARTVCEVGIQVHGGIGNTWECLAHVYLRRALLSADVLGGTGANLERVLEQHGIGTNDGLR